MTVLDRFEDLAGDRADLHLAIGVFDGVHLGHQAVMQSASARARAQGGRSMMVTFEPHPARVLRPADAPRLLTSLPHKLRLAHRHGMDQALVVPFTREFSQASASQFLDALRSGGARVRSVSVGMDWRFGCDRSGDLDSLRAIGARSGFAVEGVPPQQRNGQLVSSTLIRSLIQAGKLEDAAGYLGRPYSVLAPVVRGLQLGRSLGFPTANLACADLQLPPFGVYAGRGRLGEREWNAVLNLGSRPTVAAAGGVVQLEVHLLDYQGPEFYGEDLEITFHAALRGEQKFASVIALSEQIARDVERAREVLAR